jgi:hypothetical protein
VPVLQTLRLSLMFSEIRYDSYFFILQRYNYRLLKGLD